MTRRIRVAGKWRGKKHTPIQNDLSNPLVVKKLVIGKQRKIHSSEELRDAYAKEGTADYVVIDMLRISAHRTKRVHQFVHDGVEFTINQFSRREEMIEATKTIRRVKTPVAEVCGLGFCFRDVCNTKCPRCQSKHGNEKGKACPDAWSLQKQTEPCHCCDDCREECALPF